MHLKPLFYILQLFAKVYPDLAEEFNNRESAKLSKKSSKSVRIFLVTLSSTKAVIDLPSHPAKGRAGLEILSAR